MTSVHKSERSPEAIENVIGSGRILPVVVLQDAAHAAPLADALLAGGLRAVEVTFRTDAAAAAIEAMATRPELLVGAGTVLTPAQVDQAVERGAQFVVSPGFSPSVVGHCHELGIPVFPGVATATEIQQAIEAGIRTVKFFPAEQLGGVPMIRALAAPFRDLRFIPTGGVNAGNLREYLAVEQVLAVGGTWMVAPKLIGDWAAVTRVTREALEEATRA